MVALTNMLLNNLHMTIKTNVPAQTEKGVLNVAERGL